MKTNAELQSALHMVLARLEVPQDAAGWLAIVEALDTSLRYARKTHGLALKLKTKAKLAGLAPEAEAEDERVHDNEFEDEGQGVQ